MSNFNQIEIDRHNVLLKGVATETARLDKKLALVVITVPFLGTLLAILLWFVGYAPGYAEISVFLIFYLATAFGLEVGFHRYITHRAFQSNDLVKKTLIALGSMGMHGPVIWWAAIHRRHHVLSDEKDDSHSPHHSGDGILGLLKGLYHSHMGWLRKTNSTRPEKWQKIVKDLYKEPIVLRMHLRYYYWVVIGLVLPAIICGILTVSLKGFVLGFLWGGLVRMFAVNQCIWALNSFCHVIGSRQFHTTKFDKSRNSFFLSLLTFGQGWHNNHHAFPSSAYTGIYWWQIDIGGLLIRLLSFLGWIWEVKQPTKQMIAKHRI